MGTFLIIGSASAVNSAKAAELTRFLQSQDIEVKLASAPSTLKADAKEISHVLLLADGSMPPMAELWNSFFNGNSKPKFSALVKTILPPQFKKYFTFEMEWKMAEVALGKLVQEWISSSGSGVFSAEDLTQVGPTKSKVSQDIPFTIEHLDEPVISSAISKVDSNLSLIIEHNEVDFSFDGHSKNESSILGFSDLGVSHEQKKDDFDLNLLSLDQFELQSEIGAEPKVNSAAQHKKESKGEDQLPVGDILSEPVADLKERTSVSAKSGTSVSRAVFESTGIKDLTDSKNFLSEDDLSKVQDNSESAMIIRRYALLKEKENKEKQKTIDILSSELERVKHAQKQILKDKRNLMVKLDDAESERKALQETLDEFKHKLSTSDFSVSQKVKDYQARLENSQFQVKRLEKKLEDFKTRVRLDIQKIRARERELENRLDLQKRDAEALLAAKDSRLLNQKREIDKLQFEMEILKDRFIEETEKAEERNEKLQRALQSLKMAQGMLSGIDEGVIAIDSRQSDGGNDGEAA